MTHDPRSAPGRRRHRRVAGAAILAVVLGAGLVACGGDDDDAADATTPEGPVLTLGDDGADTTPLGTDDAGGPPSVGADEPADTAAGATTAPAGGATTAPGGVATTAPGGAATTAAGATTTAGGAASDVPADTMSAAADPAAPADTAADAPAGSDAAAVPTDAPIGSVPAGSDVGAPGSDAAATDDTTPGGSDAVTPTTVAGREPCVFSTPPATDATGAPIDTTAATEPPLDTASVGSALDGSAPPASSEPDDGPFPIVRCDTGPPVALLQQTLQLEGYEVSTIDGLFGDETEAAVQQFQADNDLPADGVVDAATWEALAPQTGGTDRNDNGMIDPNEIDFSQTGFAAPR